MTVGTALALFPFALAIAIWVAWSDMKTMKIPNRAVVALLAVWAGPGLACVVLTGLPIMAWVWGWALAGLVLLIGFIANTLRAVGAGDAKFAAAVAPFFTGADPRFVLALCAACILAAVLTHRAMRKVGAVRRMTPDWLSWTHKDFPMGLALSGTLVFHLLLIIAGVV